MKLRLRLLPAVVIAGVLVLSLRVGDIWRGTSVIEAGRSAAAQGARPAGANAQEQPAKAEAAKPETAKGEAPNAEAAKTEGAKTEAQKAEPAKAEAGKAEKSESAPSHATTPGKSGAAKVEPKTGGEAAAPAPTRAASLKGDVANLSEAEIEVLQNLSARRAALDTRAQELELREKVLKATEQRINERLKELDTIKTELEARLKVQEDFEAARLKSLVKVYETMKPKEAARIFDQLEMTVLLEFLEHMKEQKTAPILAAMDPAKAQKVTAELAARRQIQRPKG